MEFVVYAPDYRHNSAGIRVMHKLCHLLNSDGNTCWMVTPNWITNPDWKAPLAKGFQYDGKLKKRAIAIYPESVHGNPMDFKKVARYVLNNPGFIGGDTKYNPEEFIFVFLESYLKEAEKAIGRELTSDHIYTLFDYETDIFYKNGSARTTDCFYIGKGEDVRRRWKVNELGLTQITGTWPSTRKELGELLRRTHTLYSYDHNTGLLDEAKMCGCTVCVVKNGLIFNHDTMPEVMTKEQEKEMIKRLVHSMKEHFSA